MARVTVEDCIERVPNRFELVLVAAQRAREVSSGAAITIERDNDKNPVVALREIAEKTADVERLKNALVTGLQRQPEIDEMEEDRELTLPDSQWPGGVAPQGLEEEEMREDMLFINDDEVETDLDVEGDEEIAIGVGDDLPEDANVP